MSQQPLPKLIDHAGIMSEMGVKRATADAILAHCPKVEIPGVKKVHVYRADVERLIAESTQTAVVRTPLRNVA